MISTPEKNNNTFPKVKFPSKNLSLGKAGNHTYSNFYNCCQNLNQKKLQKSLQTPLQSMENPSTVSDVSWDNKNLDEVSSFTCIKMLQPGIYAYAVPAFQGYALLRPFGLAFGNPSNRA